MNIKGVKVKTENGLDDCEIDLVHSIERAVDEAMVKNGFVRTTSGKAGDYLEFNYRQFAKALPRD